MTCLAVAIAAAGLLAWNFGNRRILARVDSHVAKFSAWKPGPPALAYSTTATCVPCRAVQRPEVAEERGGEAVPTNFVIDASGRPNHVNHGVASAE